MSKANEEPASFPQVVETSNVTGAPEVVPEPPSDSKANYAPLMEGYETQFEPVEEKHSRRTRILGMSVFVFSLIIVVIVLAVALGAGLGVGLKKSNNKSSNSAGTSSSSSITSSEYQSATSIAQPKFVTVTVTAPAVAATSTASTSSASASASATPIADFFCVPKTNVVENSRFDGLTNWTTVTDSSYPSLFRAVEWIDGSPGGAYLPMVPEGEDQSLIVYVEQELNLESSKDYELRVSFKLAQYLTPSDDTSTNVYFYIVLAQASNTSNALDLYMVNNNTVYSGYNATTLTFSAGFTSFDDGDSNLYIYGLSTVADLFVYTASVYDPTDSECSSPDPDYPLDDVIYV